MARPDRGAVSDDAAWRLRQSTAELEAGFLAAAFPADAASPLEPARLLAARLTNHQRHVELAVATSRVVRSSTPELLAETDRAGTRLQALRRDVLGCFAELDALVDAERAATEARVALLDELQHTLDTGG